MRLLVIIGVLAAVAAVAYASADLSSEDAALRERLAVAVKQQEALQHAMQAKKGKWKRPDQFAMAELDGMMKQASKMDQTLRELFTHIRMRELAQGLANFRALLTESFNDQGFDTDIPKIEAVAKTHYMVIPEKMEFLSNNWFKKDSKDADTKKIHAMEKEYHLLMYDHDWLLRNSDRPIPDLLGALNKLHANRDSLNAWLASPVVGNPRALLEMASKKASTKAEEAAGSEESEEQTTTAESETEASSAVSFAETKPELLETDLEGVMPTEAEQQADNEFGHEDSFATLAAEAKALEAMEAKFQHEGML